VRQPPFPRPSAVVDPRVGDYGPALLALEDGRLFPGIAFGSQRSGEGDLVVNTSQTGYQEIATDPSYAGQLVVMTYPLIGNYGRVRADDQSRAAVAARVDRGQRHGRGSRRRPTARDDAARAGIPAIAGVDTRALARHLRSNGSLRAIVTAPGQTDPEEARALARGVPAGKTRTSSPIVSPVAARDVGDPSEGGPLVVDLDFGLKTNIVDSLRRRGARVRILPHTATPQTCSRPTWTASSSRPVPATPPDWTAPWHWRAR
jgi:carbamoyl-phosphate synthase small subunit